MDHPTAATSSAHGPVRRRMPLDTGWRLRPATPHPDAPPGLIGAALPASVPGNVFLDLLTADLIPDPYIGTNELGLRWVGSCDWTYALTFDWAAPSAQTTGDARSPDRLELVFDGLDTIASVWLDDHHVGDAASMHRTWRWTVTDLLTPGSHTLEVRFRAPVTTALARARELGPYPHSNAYPEPFNLVRTMACNFGWDWGPQLPAAGIWRPAWIESSSVARLASVQPRIGMDGTTGHVDVSVEVDTIGRSEWPLRLIASIAGETATTHTDGGTCQLSLAVPEAPRWWPHPYGDQPRSDLRVELWDGDALLDTWERPVGFRTVTLDTTPDDIGSRFQLVINDDPIWVRGANWIPDDCFPARVGRARYRERILQAKAANIDLLRIWGGGVFESDDFYDLCDELGMLVWQDFPFACATYPEDSDMATQVVAEARDNVTRLMPHPSLVLWNGNNECVWLADVDGWAAQLGERPWGRGWWEDTLPAITAAIDPTRPYWPGSPTSPATSGAPPNDPDHGTMHIWDVWNQLDYEAYRAHEPRFAAEFGYQGPPTFATLSRSIGGHDLTVDSPVLAHHQKATDGMAKLERGLAAHFALPADFDDWLYLTQLNQARAISLGIEHLRSIRDICSGSIVWQLNDCWPVISWSAIDGDGRRKPMWYALRDAYADRLLTLQPAESFLKAVLVNESSGDWSTELHARRLGLDGRLLAEVGLPVTVGARGMATVALPALVGVPRQATEEVLVVDAGPGRSIWTWLPDQDLTYPLAAYDATTEVVESGYRVTVTARTLLRDLCLFPDRLHPDATVDRMLVTLLPGEHASFLVTTPPLPDPALLAAQPVLRCVNDTRRVGRGAR